MGAALFGLVRMGKSKGGKKGQQNQQNQKKGQKKHAGPPGRAIRFAGSSGTNAQGQASKQPSGKKVEVNLSIATEAALRATIAELSDKFEVPGKGLEGEAKESASKTRERISNLYDELLRLGFKTEHIELALRNNATAYAGMREDVLDWLCLNFSADELPRKLASGAFSSASEGSVVVVSKGSTERPAKPSRDKPPPPIAAEPLKVQEQLQSQEEILEASKPARKKDLEETKDWIKKYMESSAYSESEEEEDAYGMDQIYGVQSSSGWDVYSDAREKERRRAERPDDDEEKVAQILAELERAHSEASQAKSEGNKDKQREAGKMIRDLKEELKELRVDDPSSNKSTEEKEDTIEGDMGVLFAGEMPLFGDGDAGVGAEGDSAKACVSSDDEDVLGCDMFDEDKEDDFVLPTTNPADKKDLSEEWFQVEKRKTKVKPQKDKSKPPAHEQLRMPKVLLQQFCQRNQLPNPKYEKDQSTLDKSVRYTVLVEVHSLKKGRKVGQEQKKFKVDEEDGQWANIQDAQNAVAAKALFYITNQQPLHRIIPSPFREMWVKWDNEMAESCSEQTEQRNEQKETFIDEVMSNVKAQKKSVDLSSASGRQHFSDGGRASGKPDYRRRPRGSRRGPSNDTLLKELEEKAEEKEKNVSVALPINEIRQRFTSLLEEHDFMIVCGETGSGKTTQVPQFILDNAIRSRRGEETSVVCTQPRRIAAVSVAERVASERLEPLPGEAGSRIGYHVRLDASATQDTKLLFCTTGILLRKMIGDPLLSEFSHVVIDEVHERTVQSDLLLSMVRAIVYRRQNHVDLQPLKLILMSATIDTSLLSEYLDNCPVLSVGGRTFEVKQYYLEHAYEETGYQLAQDNPASFRLRSEDISFSVESQTKDARLRSGWGDDVCANEILNPNYDSELYAECSLTSRRNLMRLNEDKIDYELLQTLLVHIDETFDEGAVLVFLPGMAEINNSYDQLVSSYHFGSDADRKAWVIPLHSNVSSEEQRRVFKRPPRGVRKVVLATNIAETSITIDDIVYVVDCGRVKERQYDASRGLGMLVEGWISAASAKQRKGRAGRVRPGVCFSLFTSGRANKLRKHPVPEIMRVPLEEVCLHIRKLNLGRCKEFLQKMVQPPTENAIDASLLSLANIGAMTEDETLTPLGHHLSGLPVDCRIGKLLLVGSILGCTSSILTVAACLSYKSPFAASYEARDAADRAKAAMCLAGSKTVAAGQFSDHLAMIAAYEGWHRVKQVDGPRAGRTYARSHHLSEATLHMISDLRRQLAAMLVDIGFISAQRGRGRQAMQWVDDSNDRHNCFAQNPTFIKICLCAALYPNIAMVDDSEDGSKSSTSWVDSRGVRVAIHPSSVNHASHLSYPYPFLVYLEKVKTSKIYMHDTTVVSPYSLMLFGGDMEIVYERSVVEIDKWIKLRVPAQTAVLLKKLRQIINGHLFTRLNTPDDTLSEQSTLITNTVFKLFDDEEKMLHRK